MELKQIPKEALVDFRREILQTPWDVFFTWPAVHQQQAITIIVKDFESFMTMEEQVKLRDAYLSTTSNQKRQEFLYEQYREALLARKSGLH